MTHGTSVWHEQSRAELGAARRLPLELNRARAGDHSLRAWADHMMLCSRACWAPPVAQSSVQQGLGMVGHKGPGSGGCYCLDHAQSRYVMPGIFEPPTASRHHERGLGTSAQRGEKGWARANFWVRSKDPSPSVDLCWRSINCLAQARIEAHCAPDGLGTTSF